MKYSIFVYAALLLLTPAAWAGSGVGWGYEGDVAPTHWNTLDAQYATCGSGKNQSPVNITHTIKADLKPLQLHYSSTLAEVVNNGHTVQVNVNPGSTVSVEGETFALKQFHFHSPSENTIQGKSFPMEAHFVHANKAGQLLVIAAMFKSGNTNPALKQIWNQMPEKAGDKKLLNTKLTAQDYLPGKLAYYRFNGSLTTPPCTEGVRWYVLKDAVTISADQASKFKHVMHHDNNRPVQTSNARVILQ